jgi:hypothetical protein
VTEQTKAIHLGLLEVLEQQLQHLLQYLFVGYSVFQVQLDRVQERLVYLRQKNNFPESKSVVLPGVRTAIREGQIDHQSAGLKWKRFAGF